MTAALRAALAPFAAAAPAFAQHGDNVQVLGMGSVTAGDFRRAAEALGASDPAPDSPQGDLGMQGGSQRRAELPPDAHMIGEAGE